MIKIVLSHIIFIFLSIIIFSQTETDSKLDSLFTRYIAIRSGNIKTKTPVIESTTEGSVKCGTFLVNELRFNFHNLSSQKQNILKPLLDRPDLQQSIVSNSGKFRIHFDTIGVDAPKYFINLNSLENADLIAQAFDSAYSFEVGFLKYLFPPSDNGDGGDNLYDVYIINLNSYGETVFENAIGENTFTSFIRIDNDFSKSDNVLTYGIDGARVTAAHELHHAIQGGNYKFDLQDRYFHEMTSTAMEEFVFNTVNDYYQYIKTYFSNPQKSFSQPNDEGYSLALWNIFLKEEFGNYGYEIIKRQWELYVNNRALTAINLSLDEHQTSFKHELNILGIWCYFTGYRTIEGKYFTDAKYYPLIKPTYRMDFTPNEQSWFISVKPLSNNYLRILGNNYTYTDTIYSIITNGDFTAGLNAPGSDFKSQFSIFSDSASGRKHIGSNYYSSFTADNIDDYLETNIFNNLLIDTTYYYNAVDFAFPNPFRYDKNQYDSKLNLPVNGKLNESARYYIFSVAMKLVYSGYGKITTSADKFVLEWNGFDNNNNRLSTGVYIYITDSEDKIKKGKIVIFNE